MAYPLNRTDGTLLVNLGDGYIDSTTGINLIGRNTPAFGEAQNQNFIRLAESFADTTPPTLSVAALNALTGTVWFDTGAQALRVYDGTNWNPTSGKIVSATQPTITGNVTLHVGDQWWDTVNSQLFAWDGSNWALVGPSAASTYGKSGNFVETILDPAGTYHVVVSTYSRGNVICITNYDSTFTPLTPISGFTTIQPGVNLVAGTVINGTATNSQTLANITPAQFARVDQDNTFAGNITTAQNITLGNPAGAYANIHFTSNNNISIHNRAYQGNLNFYVNSTVGNVNTLHIDGSTGLGTVYGDPVTSKGIATKNYVDTTLTSINANLATFEGEINNTINNFVGGYQSQLDTIVAQSTANLNATHSVIDGNVTALSASTDTRFNLGNVRYALTQSELYDIVAVMNTLAPLESPQFVGGPTVPNVQAMNNYISSLQGSSYRAHFAVPVTLNSGDYVTQTLLATTWHPYSVYGLGSLVYDIDSGNSYIVTGNTFANSFSFVSPDSLQYYYSGVTHQVANLRINDPVNNSYTANVRIVSGAVNLMQTGYISINGINAPGNDIADFELISTGLFYTGIGDNSANVATTAYVDATANLVYGDYVNRVTTLSNYLNAQVTQLNAIKANIESPIFTGNASAPTVSQLQWQTNVAAPIGGDTTSRIATTAFVAQSIQGQKFNYTVSPNPPSGGNDGDFWFQVS